jgi:hypothetical protein
MNRELAKNNFWKWFLENKLELERFIKNPSRDFAIYHEMTDELQRFSEMLYPEIAVDEDKFILIITPNGLIEGIEPTREIVAAAPSIENWEVMRFRQPRDEVSLEHHGIKFGSEDIEIITEIDEVAAKVNIIVFLKGLNNNPKAYQTLAFLYMDHILGEFNTITKVGFIDFKHLEKDQTVDGSINLLELRKLIEDKLY